MFMQTYRCHFCASLGFCRPWKERTDGPSAQSASPHLSCCPPPCPTTSWIPFPQLLAALVPTPTPSMTHTHGFFCFYFFFSFLASLFEKSKLQMG